MNFSSIESTATENNDITAGKRNFSGVYRLFMSDEGRNDVLITIN